MAKDENPWGLGEILVLCALGAYTISRFFGWSIAIGILVVGFCYQFYKWYRISTTWKRLGVPQDFSWPLIGQPQLATKGIPACDMEWTRKYGKLYGSYLLNRPEIVVSDEDILKRVLVKDFNNFNNRRTFVSSKKSLFSRVLSVLKDDEWKHTRNTLTPAFTSGKLKSTIQLMEKSINTMCSIIAEQADLEGGLDVKKIMGSMTLDVIAAVAFAVDANTQRDPNNAFIRYAQELGNITLKDWRAAVTLFFPKTVVALREYFNIQLFFSEMENYYQDSLTEVIKQRRQNPHLERPDFLQLLINSVDGKDSSEVPANEINGSSSNQKWRMSDRDMVAQSLLFLFAGHETTATTLTFACYCLAWNQEAQAKAYEEIKAVVEKDGAITYDHIQKGLPYLDAVLSETMRLYPPATRFDRECIEDYQLTAELTIPKGSVVVVPVYAIHHNPENFEDPEKFIPERFLDKNQINPFAYLPFGYGPRNCIGMRFAQLESKLTLANLIKNFRIETCVETEPMPPVLDVTGILRTKKPIKLNFHQRQE